MTGPSYGPRVLDHYLHPRNVGSFDAGDPRVGTALVGSPALGQILKLQIRLEGATIEAVRFRAFGSGEAIAAGSLATEWLQGRDLDQALAIGSQDIVQALDLPAGPHTVEIRNGNFPARVERIVVKPGQSVRIRHRFR